MDCCLCEINGVGFCSGWFVDLRNLSFGFVVSNHGFCV